MSLAPVGAELDNITLLARVIVVVSVCPRKAAAGLIETTCARRQVEVKKRKKIKESFFMLGVVRSLIER